MKLAIEVQDGGVQALFRALPDVVRQRVKAAALVTGRLIASEARGRVARRTGQTAEAITVAEVEDAVLVYVGRTAHPANLAQWLEFGTRRMTARPFLYASAQLEEGSHLRRVGEAVQASIQEVGG